MPVISENAFHVSQAVPNIAKRRCGITTSESMEEGERSGIFSPKFVCNRMYCNVSIVLLDNSSSKHEQRPSKGRKRQYPQIDSKVCVAQ